jgi:hypothetical protein
MARGDEYPTKNFIQTSQRNIVQKRLVQLISPEYYFHPMQAPYTSLVPLVSTLEHNTTQESH